MNRRKHARNYLSAVFSVLIVGLMLTSSVFGQSALTHGHQVLLDRGLQLKALTFPSAATGGLDMALWNESGFTTVDVWMGAYDHGIPAGLPSGSDALDFAVWTDNTSPLVSSAAYLPNLVSIQYGDEQSISSSALPGIASAVSTLQNKYPNSIIYTNQAIGSSGYNVSNFSLSTLQTYTQTVKPDMLHFTEYPFRWQGTQYSAKDYEGGSPKSFYVHMEMYRKAGLAGLDGTGNHPIPVGMYTQTYRAGHLNNRYPTESEFRLQQFAGWAFGMKSIDSFVYNNAMGLDGMFFEGTTQTPTQRFYQYAELNRQSGNLGDALVRLISTDVRMKMGRREDGQFNPLPSDNASQVAVGAWNSLADAYLKNISAVNLGTKNNGMEGDVIVGFFNPLDESLVEAGAEDDVYFMVVNGLTDEAGSAQQCRQEITLEFDFADSGIDQLLRINRDTGEVEVIELVSDGGGLYHLELILDGGTGDLFKYDTGTSFVPEPASIIVCTLCSVVMLRKKRK